MADETSARRQNRETTMAGWLAVTPQRTLDMLASFQATVIEELLRRIETSADQIGADSIIVAGGVACNTGLRARAGDVRGLSFYFPSRGLSTDNAAMIAAAAFPKFKRCEFASFDLKVQPALVLA